MTDTVVIDESGDLGPKGSEYFAMAAMILSRTRNLKSAYKTIPKDGKEHKWYNSDEDEILELFEAMGRCRFGIVYSVIKKNKPLSDAPVYGNELYDRMVCQVVDDALSHLGCRDVKVYLDNNRFISTERFREIVRESSVRSGVNPLEVRKRDSKSTPCLQLVDFVAGSVRAKYERGDTKLSIIEDKISFARRL